MLKIQDEMKRPPDMGGRFSMEEICLDLLYRKLMPCTDSTLDVKCCPENAVFPRLVR